MVDHVNSGVPMVTTDFAAKLVAGIAESRASTVIAGGGKPLLRMLKSGDWVFGPSNEEVQDGSPWIVNIMTLGHGWSCWVQTAGNAKNELRGEIMTSMAEPKPLRPPPIDGTQYAEQRSFEAKCYDGADAGTEVLHKTASIGGMRAIDDLLVTIQKRLAMPGGVAYPFPVIVLGHDHYEHTKWGRIYTPVFEVVAWANGNGELEPETAGTLPNPFEDRRQPPEPANAPRQPAKPALAPTKPAEPAKPRKPSLAAAAKSAAPVSTTQAHVGQRRRPAAR
jgi:hypothetical protein